MVRNLAIIPARSGSKRVIDKNIRPFAGRPLMAWIIDAARTSGVFERVYVSTDSEKYADIARACGAWVPFLRDGLMDDHSPLAQVACHELLRVERELRRVAMTDYAKADPTRLSGGQKQRVAIAGALAMEPQLIVFDEPGSLLDVRGRSAIMRVMGRLHDDGITIVHITHFMEEALQADRVIVLERGRIALEGTPVRRRGPCESVVHRPTSAPGC